MARKIKFALEMADGYKVRNSLEELREHFDIDTIVSHFLSGKLQEWLDDRYYEDEASQVSELSKDSPELHNRLCAILGVEHVNSDNTDIESLERLNEKKSILRQKTSDKQIIDNAAITALSQEDLADLLDANESIIYLVGEKFNIPIRMTNKKYIGILGTPVIKIQAKNPEELEDKDISFENVILPWTPKQIEVSPVIPTNTLESQSQPSLSSSAVDEAVTDDTDDLIDEFIEVFNSTFTSWKPKNDTIWEVTNLFGTASNEKLTPGKKKIALRLICKNAYTEKELVHIKVIDDLSAGYALTKDSVCFGGNFGNILIRYNELCQNGSSEPIEVRKEFKGTFSFDEIFTYVINTKNGTFTLASSVEHEGLDVLHDDMHELNNYLKTIAKLSAI
ncbi:hypothetical protein SAMN05216582_10138 [Selenomonas ruminantium]|uniref:Uncharacterized protein n=1 Tax=Selenomonas ruminantium TaxID=971 RepID=A0A1M6QXX1_SELRU|nr:hypothetical protein [Selenomonas ruminantium]SHK24917.1 hypothetical protein SAMN05216582_10138 [Selenomonas ruminantium]